MKNRHFPHCWDPRYGAKGHKAILGAKPRAGHARCCSCRSPAQGGPGFAGPPPREDRV